MEPKIAHLSSAPSRSFPHPSPLPPLKKPIRDTLSSLKQEEVSQDPINGLFLTHLTQIFAKKYALSLDTSSEASQSIREELYRMLDDLRRVQKWTESTIRQTEKALQECTSTQSRAPKPTSCFKHYLTELRAWFKKISTN